MPTLISAKHVKPLGVRLVKILVSGANDKFFIHEDLLRASSLFFDAALADLSKQPGPLEIRLPKEESNIFALYRNWLCCGKIAAASMHAASDYLELAKAFHLADRMKDVRFQNAVCDLILERGQSYEYPSSDAIQYAFSHAGQSAQLRHLLVDMFANVVSGQWFRRAYESQTYPRSFMVMLAERVMDNRRAPNEMLQPSAYHEPPSMR